MAASPEMQPYRDYRGPWGQLTGIVGYAEGDPGKGAGGDHPSDIHATVVGPITTRPWISGTYRHYRKRND